MKIVSGSLMILIIFEGNLSKVLLIPKKHFVFFIKSQNNFTSERASNSIVLFFVDIVKRQFNLTKNLKII